jgi:hypothetical protein
MDNTLSPEMWAGKCGEGSESWGCIFWRVCDIVTVECCEVFGKSLPLFVMTL